MENRLYLMAGVALTVMSVDWMSKIWAQDNLFVVYNDRVAAWWPVPLLIFATLFFFLINQDKLTAVSLGLLTGGWMANFIDRAFFGPVTDFIPLPRLIPNKELYANIADAAIITSVILAVYVGVRTIRLKREERREQELTQGSEEPTEEDVSQSTPPKMW